MVRKWVAATSIFGILSCGQPDPESTEQAQALADFSFRELLPGVTTVAQAEKAGTVTRCETSGANETRCEFAKATVGNIPIMGSRSYIIFKHDKFDWFTIAPYSENFDDIAAVLRSIYGAPCATSSEPLQNAYGAQYSGDAGRWCFKQGDLTLRRHSESGDSLVKGDLDFFTNHPEDAKPAAIFDAKTI